MMKPAIYPTTASLSGDALFALRSKFKTLYRVIGGAENARLTRWLDVVAVATVGLGLGFAFFMLTRAPAARSAVVAR